jgi:hypothetical protein
MLAIIAVQGTNLLETITITGKSEAPVHLGISKYHHGVLV